jgi:hypothetical protein
MWLLLPLLGKSVNFISGCLAVLGGWDAAKFCSPLGFLEVVE